MKPYQLAVHRFIEGIVPSRAAGIVCHSSTTSDRIPTFSQKRETAVRLAQQRTGSRRLRMGSHEAPKRPCSAHPAWCRTARNSRIAELLIRASSVSWSIALRIVDPSLNRLCNVLQGA